MVKVAGDLPLDQLGPLGCGVQTGAGAVLNQMRLAAGQSLAVFGAGAVGLSAVMAARLAGASEIAVVDINPARLELAARLGATRVVDGRDGDVAKAVTGGGGGLDFSFDTTGVAAVMDQAIAVLTRPGTCVLVGAGMDSVTVHPSALAGKIVTYCYEGAAVPQLFIPKLIGLWQQGLFPFDQLIRTYPLDEINQAEADAVSGATVKPVILMP
jgi:aryl-alcohol dehydrogenase